MFSPSLSAGEPKAIPWTHTTPLRCGADAFFHQDVRPGDVLCWPTNMGWMMGPWLVYAGVVKWQAGLGLLVQQREQACQLERA